LNFEPLFLFASAVVGCFLGGPSPNHVRFGLGSCAVVALYDATGCSFLGGPSPNHVRLGFDAVVAVPAGWFLGLHPVEPITRTRATLATISHRAIMDDSFFGCREEEMLARTF
jgi:hypothetical protein